MRIFFLIACLHIFCPCAAMLMDEKKAAVQFIASLKTKKDMHKRFTIPILEDEYDEGPYCPSDEPAIIYFADKNKIALVKKILAKNPPLGEIKRWGNWETIFHSLARDGNSRLMKTIFDHCKKRKIDIVKIINFRKNEYDATPIFYAAENQRTRCLELLLVHGALVNIAQPNGYTPLHWAARSFTKDPEAQLKTVKLLCEAGADIFAKTTEFSHLRPCIAEELAVLRHNSETADFLRNLRIRKTATIIRNGPPNYLTLLPPEIFIKVHEFIEQRSLQEKLE